MATTPNDTFARTITTPQGTWLIGPGGETALAKHMDGGYGRIYCWHDNTLFVQGLGGNDNWYVWRTENHWELYGATAPIPMPPSFKPLPRRTIEGAYFYVGGQRTTIIETTDFQLLQRALAGEDIRPVLDQRHELGFNTLRVLGMASNMFRLFPQEHPDYFATIVKMANLAAERGLYIEFTVFADATVVMPAIADQVNHWNAVGNLAGALTNVSLELVNEENQPINRLACKGTVTPIVGVLCSHGSNGSEAVPVRPPWSYETFHTNDSFEWWRKVGHNAMELSTGAENLPASHAPVVANENTRPDHDGTRAHFYDAAAAAALLTAGSCFHSNSGKSSVIFEGIDLDFAKAWVQGAKSVPLEFQDGTYIRRDDIYNAEQPAILRAYERRLPDGRGFVVRIRR